MSQRDYSRLPLQLRLFLSRTAPLQKLPLGRSKGWSSPLLSRRHRASGSWARYPVPSCPPGLPRSRPLATAELKLRSFPQSHHLLATTISGPSISHLPAACARGLACRLRPATSRRHVLAPS